MPATEPLELSAATLLSTKLFVPRTHPSIVSRPRLVARLIEGTSRRLTVISAPTGAGKTTLIAEWHANAPGHKPPLAWLTLDERDNDPHRFIAYVSAAIGQVFEDVREEFDSLIRVASAVDIDHTVVLLLNLLNRRSEPFVLVIDDYQVIDNQAIHRAMDYLIANAPPAMRLIIASRTEPPLALARLRVRNQLVEIRTADLRFTPDEVRALLREVAGIDAGSAEAGLLTSRTDGWAAGLQLAILSLQGGDSLEEQLREFGGHNRFIADYLIEEVINRQPPEIRDFLTRISLLDRFTADLCDAVAETDRSADYLRYLEQHNLFLVPLDTDRRWFRYHALFQELLQRQLEECCPDSRESILRRASLWFREAGIGAEAVEYALRAGDRDLAATILADDDVAAHALIRGELETVLRWLDAIGDERRVCRPNLTGVVIWSLVSNGRVEEIEPYIAEIERYASDASLSEEDQRISQGLIYAGKTVLAAHRREYREAIRLSDKALAHLPDDFPIATANTLYSRGFALGLTGDLAGSLQAFQLAVETLGPDRSPTFRILARTAYVQALINLANLADAEETLRSMLSRIDEMGLSEWPYVGFVHICLARVLIERGRYDDALAEAEIGGQLAARWATGTFELEGHFTIATIEAARGNLEAARAELGEARKLVPVTGPNPLLARLEALEFHCDPENAEAARQWATELLDGIPGEPIEVWPWLAAYDSAIFLAIRRGAIDAACGAAEKLHGYAEDAGWKLAALHLTVAHAYCIWTQGQRDDALAEIRPVVEVARSAGVVRPFLETGPEMPALLRALELDDATAAWRDHILSLLADPGETEALVRPRLAAGSAAQLVEPLSARELEVLEQIMLGKTNSQIATDLFIAEGTVKRHTHNIYAKLGVTSRTQAIARAIELGLLTD